MDFNNLKRPVRNIDLMADVVVGGIYVHFKDSDEEVIVIGFCVIEASDELGVLYISHDIPICRPIVSFLEIINGSPRFKRVL